MKKIIITVLVALMLTTAAFASNEVTVTEAGNFHIYYNDIEQKFTDVNGTQVLPLVNNGTTYLPVRAMSNLAGLGVEWVAETSTIKLTSGGTQSTYGGIPTGSVNTVNVTVADNFTITLDGTVKTFTDVNGTVVYPIVNNGTTYLPVRAVCGLVNIAVEWDGTTSSIYLGTHTATPVVTPAVGSKSVDGSTPDKVVTKTGPTKSGIERYYTINTSGYDYIRLTASAVMDSADAVTYPDMGSAVAGNGLLSFDSFSTGTEVVLDVSEQATVVLWVKECKPSASDALTPLTITLETAAVVPAYSIPSGATALTDANTHFNSEDTTYSNGQFIFHNNNPMGHTPSGIDYNNSGYTTLTYTLTTKSIPMFSRVENANAIIFNSLQCANTTKTYTVDISGQNYICVCPIKASVCDSVITNIYVI